MVELHREIRNVEDYFDLIQVRYEDQLKLEIHIADDISLDWAIIKLSIQPIIENAIQHGILPKEDFGKIKVEIQQESAEIMSIRITDDGVGIAENQVLELNEMLEGIGLQSGSKQLGLRNIHDRIQSLFGKAYGLNINSIPYVGTTVQIKIPIIREMDQDAKRFNG